MTAMKYPKKTFSLIENLYVNASAIIKINDDHKSVVFG
jgi:hypothetical protein